ncbi:hypothetical protein XENOCAPTIV_023518 [Xenoophorus captivus]|uniref:Uncharacterized protein n=1 Tax=Xenoophorus captivus TaxID=1517983 RepID=A0ABV0RRW1_9TELE
MPREDCLTFRSSSLLKETTEWRQKALQKSAENERTKLRGCHQRHHLGSNPAVLWPNTPESNEWLLTRPYVYIPSWIYLIFGHFSENMNANTQTSVSLMVSDCVKRFISKQLGLLFLYQNDNRNYLNDPDQRFTYPANGSHKWV